MTWQLLDCHLETVEEKNMGSPNCHLEVTQENDLAVARLSARSSSKKRLGGH